MHKKQIVIPNSEINSVLIMLNNEASNCDSNSGNVISAISIILFVIPIVFTFNQA